MRFWLAFLLFTIVSAQPGAPGKCNICGCPDCQYLVPVGVVGFYYDPHDRPYQFSCQQLQWKMDNSIAIDQDFCKEKVPPIAWEPCKCVNALGQLLTEYPPPGFGVTAAPSDPGYIPPTRAPVKPMDPVYYDEPKDRLPLLVILGILAILLALCLCCCICCILCYICCKRRKDDEEERRVRYVIDENEEIVAGYVVFDKDGQEVVGAVYDESGTVVYGTPCDEFGNIIEGGYTDDPGDQYDLHMEEAPYTDGPYEDGQYEMQMQPDYVDGEQHSPEETQYAIQDGNYIPEEEQYIDGENFEGQNQMDPDGLFQESNYTPDDQLRPDEDGEFA